MKTKIFLFSHAMSIDGVAASLLGLLKELDYSKVDVDLMLMSATGPLMSEIPKKVNLLPTPDSVACYWSAKSSCSKFSIIAKSIRLVSLCIAGVWYKIFRRIKIDQYGLGLIAALMWDEFLPKKIVQGKYDLALFFSCQPVFIGRVDAKKSAVWVHTDWGNFHPIKWLINRFFTRADYIVNVSDAAKESFDRYLKPRFGGKSVVVENCLSPAWMKAKAAEGSIDMTDADLSTIKILSVGRVSPPKNYFRALEAAKILDAKRVNFRWLIVGDGESMASLKGVVAQSGLGEKFQLLGSKNNPYPYYKWCDMLVCTSDWEGKSVAVREAQIFAKPVVCTRFPTASSQIEDGVDGLLVERTDVAVADGVQRIAGDIALRERLSGNCRNRDFANRNSIDTILGWSGISEV